MVVMLCILDGLPCIMVGFSLVDFTSTLSGLGRRNTINIRVFEG